MALDCDEKQQNKLDDEPDEFPRLVLYFKGNKFTHATAVGDKVIIDTQANDIPYATIVLIACYYVFNLKYPTCWQHFLGLIQHIVVQEKYSNSSQPKLANKILEIQTAMDKEGPRFTGIGKQC